MPWRKFVLPALVFLSLTLMIVVYWWGYGNTSIGTDDANIYFVYMKHFAEGHGFVWNVGGEKVEGFTSLIWTLIGALCYKITPAHFHTLLLLINFLLIFFTLYNVLRFSRRINNTEEKAIAPADVIMLSLLLLPLGFIEWGVISLMETGLWTFLLVHLTLELCKYFFEPKNFSVWKFALMLVVLDMTRPESLAYSLLFIVMLFVIAGSAEGWKTGIRRITFPLIAHAGAVIAIISWRLSYFGYPFPNTYYAKVSGSLTDNIKAGMKYLFTFFYAYPHAALVVALLIVFIVLGVRNYRLTKNPLTVEEKVIGTILIVILAAFALPVITGGDHFRYSRFYQPILPLVYLAVTCTSLWKNYLGMRVGQNRLAVTGLALSVAFAALFFGKTTVFDFLTNRNSVNFNLFLDFTLAREGRAVGHQLNDAFAPLGKYPSLGALATGGVAYAYEGNTIDLLGLNNTTMAHATRIKVGFRNHASFDKEGFWKLKPDIMGTYIGANIVKDSDTALFILPENTPAYRSSDFVYLCYKGIFDDADFRNTYFPALVKNKGKDYYVFTYYSTWFLDTLQKSGAYEIKMLERKPVPAAITKTQ